MTAAVIFIGVIFYLIWEGLSLYHEDDNIVTITEAVVTACRSRLWILVIIGAVLGHWFWSYCPPC